MCRGHSMYGSSSVGTERQERTRHAVPVHNGDQRRKNFVCYLLFITTQLEAYHWSCPGSRPRYTSSRPGGRGTRGGHHQVHTLTYVRTYAVYMYIHTYVCVPMYVWSALPHCPVCGLPLLPGGISPRCSSASPAPAYSSTQTHRQT